MRCVIGLDIGTTSTIGILVRLPDQVLAMASRPTRLFSDRAGWAEEDPEEWWANACAITRELVSSAGIDPGEIAAIGTTGMLPAVVLLDEQGRLLRRSIQQSDGRCGAEVEELRREVDQDAFLARCGNGVNQQLVTAKLRWIERNEPEVFRRIATVFGSYDFVNWRLTGARRVEQNWALEAGFVDVTRGVIADDLVALAHVGRGAVPELAASHEVVGRLTAKAAEQTGLAAGTPVVAGAADMIASALAAGVTEPGQVLLKFGGAVDILVATDRVLPDPRLYLDYHLVPGFFMPNGCMSTGGSGLNWFARTFASGEVARAEASGLSLHQHLDRLAAARPPGSNGLTVLPYLLGEKTPIHEPDARGVIDGLTLTHELGDLWRAFLEGYAYAIAHHVAVLRDIGHEPRTFIATDGGSASEVWMGIVADVLQAPVQRLAGHPGSALGAAWTAAIGTGLASDWSGIGGFVSQADRIEPDPANAEVYARGFARFLELSARSRSGSAS